MKKLTVFALVLAALFLVSCSKKTVYTDSLVKVEGGDFIMGSDNLKLPYGYYSHQEHNASVSTFFISPFLVTQAEFEEVMGYNPSYYQVSNGKNATEGEIPECRPVEKVTWYEAVMYCNKLSILNGLDPVYSLVVNEQETTDVDFWGESPKSREKTDWTSIIFNPKANGYRLPTEAEWEYAARGGNLTQNFSAAGFNFNEGNADDYAWSSSNAVSMTHQVGLLQPNELGLYDMSGNLWEWCQDWFDADFYITEEASLKDTAGPEETKYKALRSSTWDEADEDLSVFVRGATAPYDSSRRGGFRIARNEKTRK